MNVYEFKLKPNDIFLFYNRDGHDELFLVNDELNYPPNTSNLLWNKQTQAFDQVKCPYINKVILPTFNCNKEDYEDCVIGNLTPLIKHGIDLEDIIDRNILLAIKHHGDIIEIGMCFRKFYMDKVFINEKYSKQVNRILKLQVFS